MSEMSTEEIIKMFGCKRDDKIVEMLEDRVYVKPKTIKNTYYPSELSLDPCLRRMVYQEIEELETVQTDTPISARTLELGNKIEEIIIDMAKASGRYIDDQVRIIIQDERLEKLISGYADLIIDGSPNRDRNPEHFIPIEIKSSKDFPFKSKAWMTGLDRQPKLEHLVQLTMYLHHLGAPFGYLVYFNKDTSGMLSHRVEYNPEVYEKVIQNLITVEQCLRDNVLPPRAFQAITRNGEFVKSRVVDGQTLKSDWHCLWVQENSCTGEKIQQGCPFRYLCWDVERKE